MSDKTGIEWAWVPGYRGASWNPIRAKLKDPGPVDGPVLGWHCEKVPGRKGCAHCYAATWNKRMGTGLDYAKQNRELVEVFLSNLDLPLRKKRIRYSWFVNSMTDIFADFVTDEMRHDIFKVMIQANHHIYIVLTKRHAEAMEFIRTYYPTLPEQKHIWFGGSAEDQESANVAVPYTLATPAAVRLISYEPALADVDWAQAMDATLSLFPKEGFRILGTTALDWILIGGESGLRCRGFDVNWARRTVRWCHENGAAPFVKQLGGQPFESAEILGRSGVTQHLQMLLQDRKGGNWDEWPADLRVREFPSIHKELQP